MKSISFFLVLFLLPTFAFSQINWSDQQIIRDDVYYSYQICAADFDGDGDMDLAALNDPQYPDGDIVWIENHAVGGEFFMHSIAPSLLTPRAVVAADLDQDGDMDIVGSDRLSQGKVLWLENNGEGVFTQHVVYSFFDGADGVAVADLDGDGDNDIIGTSSGTASQQDISWWENDGEENFTMHVIDSDFVFACAVTTSDLDGDGDLDVVATSGYYYQTGAIAWWENMGGAEFSRHDLANYYPRASNPVVADMNYDGIPDILATSADLDRLDWAAGDGTPQDGGWEIHNLSNDYNYAHGLKVADMDGDCLPDIVTCAQYGNVVSWWQNRGDGDFTEYVISNSATSAVDVIPVDLDGDGDLDVAASLFEAHKIVWWENLTRQIHASFTLVPHNLTIPAEGGSLTYDVGLASQIPYMEPGFWFWTSIECPTGQVFSPLENVEFTHQPFMDVYYSDLSLVIEGNAPAGKYTYMGKISRGETVVLEDAFQFEKLASENQGEYPSNPENLIVNIGSPFTEFVSSPSGTNLAAAFQVSEAYPNPFNPTSQLSIELPQTAELYVGLYNVHGQQVQQLAKGTYSAGSHTFTIDGTDLSAGMYFVHARIPNKMDEVRKLILLK